MMFQTTLFLNMNKTQGLTVGLSDLLNVDLYNDSLKMFNRAWAKNIIIWPLVMTWMNMFWRTCMSDKRKSLHS